MHFKQWLSHGSLQAAAERAHGAFHPILSSSSILAYLRLQHSVQHNILSGRRPSQPPLHPAASQGCFSQDCTKSASLAPGHQLHVRDVFSGQLLCGWDLPHVPAAFTPTQGWAWCSAGQHLTLLFGQIWSNVRGLSYQQDGQATGLVHIDARSGRTATSQLQLGQLSGRVWASVHFCAQRSQVLVLHGDHTYAKVLTSIFDACGSLLHSSASLQGDFRAIWAPSGQAVTFWDMGNCSIWALGEICGGSIVRVEGPVKLLAWATPLSDRLCLLLGGDQVVIMQHQQAQLRAALARPLASYYCDAVWGTCLAVLDCSFELQVYSVDEAGLALERIILPGSGRHFARGSIRLAAHGELCAIFTGTVAAEQKSDRHLAVIHLASGCLREFAVQDDVLASTLLDYQVQLRWTQDCTAVLVSAKDGSHNELFKFCY